MPTDCAMMPGMRVFLILIAIAVSTVFMAYDATAAEPAYRLRAEWQGPCQRTKPSTSISATVLKPLCGPSNVRSAAVLCILKVQQDRPINYAQTPACAG